jgi:hypothetical protein
LCGERPAEATPGQTICKNGPVTFGIGGGVFVIAMINESSLKNSQNIDFVWELFRFLGAGIARN